MKKIDNIRIKFMPDELTMYETSLYWNDESNCLEIMNITLEKYDTRGRTIDFLSIR